MLKSRPSNAAWADRLAVLEEVLDQERHTKERCVVATHRRRPVNLDNDCVDPRIDLVRALARLRQQFSRQ